MRQRASVVLLAAQGWQNKVIAVEVKLDRRQVALWRGRFIDGGVEALLQDASRPGRTPSVTPEVESRIVNTTLHDKPAAATHWSTRTLAAHLVLSASTVRRVWKRNGLKPHLQRTFKLSRDPRFEDKLLDVVGLYMKLGELRAVAVAQGWLDPGDEVPDDQAIIAALGPGQRVGFTVSSVEPHRSAVKAQLEAGVQGRAIHAALKREHGYTGSYSAAERMLRQLRGEMPPEVTVRLSFAPGEAAQVDFGAGPVLMHPDGSRGAPGPSQ